MSAQQSHQDIYRRDIGIYIEYMLNILNTRGKIAVKSFKLTQIVLKILQL